MSDTFAVCMFLLLVHGTYTACLNTSAFVTTQEALLADKTQVLSLRIGGK